MLGRRRGLDSPRGSVAGGHEEEEASTRFSRVSLLLGQPALLPPGVGGENGGVIYGSNLADDYQNYWEARKNSGITQNVWGLRNCVLKVPQEIVLHCEAVLKLIYEPYSFTKGTPLTPFYFKHGEHIQSKGCI